MSRGSHDGSEPGIGSEWDVCNPAAPDAACTSTLASTDQPSTWVNATVEPDKWLQPDTPTATLRHEARSESADVASKLSVSPAYSMLPWDKPGMWPSARDSVRSVDPQASMPPSTAAAYAPDVGGPALSEPMPFMRQPSRLSMTAVRSTQRSRLPEGIVPHARPLNLRTINDSKQNAHLLEGASAQARQHDGISSRPDLLLLARKPVSLPGITLVEHRQQGGTTAQSDPLSNVHWEEASTPRYSPSGISQEHRHLSKEAFVAELLGQVQLPLQDSHTASPAQGNTAEQVTEAGHCQVSVTESVEQAVAWQRPLCRTSDDVGLANAEMQRLHQWLSIYGYSDAAVHVTATLADAPLPASIAGSDGKHVNVSSPVNAPLPAQKLADNLHRSNPYGLGISNRKEQVGPPLAARPYVQTDVGHLRPGTASNRTGSAVNQAVPPASSASSPMNGQDVALNRTVPSIWDLDM